MVRIIQGYSDKIGNSMFEESDGEITPIELKELVNFLPYPIMVFQIEDHEYRKFFLNEKFLKQIGYSLDEIPTRESLAELIYPNESYRSEIFAEWRTQEKNVQETGKGFIKMKACLSCKSGEKRWFEIKASVINDLQIIAFVDINSDVILHEKLKQEKLNNQRMLSILGHDLRGLIANLFSISSLAGQSEISHGEFISMQQMIREESAEVLELLETTFNWARLNFNNIEPKIAGIDFTVLLNSVLKIYKYALEGKNLTVTAAVEKLNNIENDYEVLTIIIRNLISNAIKFTPKNGLIFIDATEDTLTISDNGIGMTQDMADAVLRRGYESRRGTCNEKGIGLGLQLVMSLAEKINCDIKIKSEVAKGTAVTIVFGSK